MKRLRRRYGHGRAHHGPGISWQGTTEIERRYYGLQPMLASAALGLDTPAQRDAAIAKGSALLTWMLSMKTAGAGARGRRFLEHKISEVRWLLHKAEAR